MTLRPQQPTRAAVEAKSLYCEKEVSFVACRSHPRAIAPLWFWTARTTRKSPR